MSAQLERMLARGHSERISLQELAAWFAGLPPTGCDFMQGNWTGGVFNTGHPGELMLAQMRWCGKNFNSVEDVAPIVCRDEQGHRIVSEAIGAARLRMISAPGESAPTAAMVYDKHPIIDYFKRLDDDTVLGVMDRKGDAFPLYFYLQRWRGE
ncbi:MULTISPECIES: DUF4334 domain-containing protein [Burkholderia]|uniref:DUF4334 domain-containing protein n=1 Tax=Burkholderia TaxID=32008 RepID=UPI0008415A86|nr:MULTISPECIES: DUF4334 domain-containing protein [unclassified Burkholderia]